MSGAAVYHFREGHRPAKQLAALLGVDSFPVATRQFPDGESLVRVPGQAIESTAILYRSLDKPNARLVEVVLAASALRDGGARRVILVAPYLSYMRQDIAFRPGEAVSQKVVGALLARAFDAVITVDPHLHRIASLDEALPHIPSRAVAAAPALAGMIRGDRAPDTVIIGPDSESRPWVEDLAGRLGVEWMVGEKRRIADREVALTLPDPERLHGRPVIIVDDLLSSGGTMLSCVEEVRKAGAARVEAVVTHCLARRLAISRLLASGLDRIRSTDSVAGPTNAVSLAPVVAPIVADVIRLLDRTGLR